MKSGVSLFLWDCYWGQNKRQEAIMTPVTICELRLTSDCFFLKLAKLVYHSVTFSVLKVATGSANLSDLRSIHSAIVLYRNAISLLYDTYFSGDLQVIEGLLMKDFSLLDGLYRELSTAVGELMSDYSVMEGYSNIADELKEKLDDNTREVDKLRNLYRYIYVFVFLFQDNSLVRRGGYFLVQQPLHCWKLSDV